MRGETPNEMVSGLYEFLADRLDPRQLEKVKRAVVQAQMSHAGQRRDGGEPYIIHPLRVASDLAMKLDIHDSDSICAALLHDTLEEDQQLSLEKLARAFGPGIAHTVATLTKPAREDQTHEEVNDEYLPRIQMAGEQVRLIKLRDRLDNVRDLSNCPESEKRRRIIAETRSFYLPLIESLAVLHIRDRLRTAFSQALVSANTADGIA